MIRILLVILIALLLGTGLAMGLQYDLGYIRISLGNYLVETNFWIGLALLVVLVAGLVMAINLFRRLRHGTGMVAGWLARSNERRARRRTTQGLLALAEGNWPRARKLLTSSAEHADTPLINYLAAAQASFNPATTKPLTNCCARPLRAPPDPTWPWALPRPSCNWPAIVWSRPSPHC